MSRLSFLRRPGLSVLKPGGQPCRDYLEFPMINERAKHRSYLSFILPAFIIYAGIMVFPLVFSVGLSFTSWKGYGPIKFVGLDNYTAAPDRPGLSYRVPEQYSHSAYFCVRTDTAWASSGIYASPPHGKRRRSL